MVYLLMVGHSFQNYDIVYVGFSVEYTCLYLLRTGFYPIYTTISIAYIRVFKDAYICLTNTAYTCVIQTCPGLNANEMHALYNKHHKVSSLLKVHLK